MPKPGSDQKEKGSPVDCGTRVNRHANGRREHTERANGMQLLRSSSKPSVLERALELKGKDELLQFTMAAQERMNGSLVRCEERYPDRGHHSVLYVVVDGEREKWEKDLRGLHRNHFGPGHGDPLAPVRLEVVDRATDVALQRLIEAGLLAATSHATRPLFSAEGLSCGILPLSDEEQQKAAQYRRIAARKLKMARVVLQAGLEEDVRVPLLDAILALGRAFAVEQRLPEPNLVHEALLPPISPSWDGSLPLLREFSIESTHPGAPVLEMLSRLLPDA